MNATDTLNHEAAMRQPELLCYDIDKEVIAFSTTRKGGYSTGNYAGFNINRYCGDDEAHIKMNRRLLCDMLHIDDDRLIMPHQVHLTKTVRIDATFFTLSAEEKQQRLEGVDAVMTELTGVCVGVSTADCIPILVYDRRQHVIAAIHAGWRGTVRRIVTHTIADMSAAYGSKAEDMIVQIGPGIGIDSFEVGDEVYEAFAEAGFKMETISRRMEKWHIDLPECNRQQLMAVGVPQESIAMANICTVKRSDKFFSARRLSIMSGRIFSGILRMPSSAR